MTNLHRARYANQELIDARGLSTPDARGLMHTQLAEMQSAVREATDSANQAMERQMEAEKEARQEKAAAASAVEIAKGLRERLQLEHEARQSASAAKAGDPARSAKKSKYLRAQQSDALRGRQDGRPIRKECHPGKTLICASKSVLLEATQCVLKTLPSWKPSKD